ncbi:MAG TPA: hypothetical protein PL141_08445 [Thermoflexales bacterium]|nr:hypothetical protein [Thermoflexales bacterium]HQW36030.1 hypothetical protein [Thermoflexales bacterium]
MIKKGPKSGSATWTADDWALFEEKGRNYFFRSDIGDRTSLSDFAHEIGNLAKFYSNDESEQFVSGIALLYAGVPYDQRGAGAMISQGMGGGARISVSSCNNQGLECAWLHHTSFGFSRKYTE